MEEKLNTIIQLIQNPEYPVYTKELSDIVANTNETNFLLTTILYFIGFLATLYIAWIIYKSVFRPWIVSIFKF